MSVSFLCLLCQNEFEQTWLVVISPSSSVSLLILYVNCELCRDLFLSSITVLPLILIPLLVLILVSLLILVLVLLPPLLILILFIPLLILSLVVLLLPSPSLVLLPSLVIRFVLISLIHEIFT